MHSARPASAPVPVRRPGSVGVYPACPEARERAAALAAALHVPFTSNSDRDRFELLLVCTADQLELRDSRDRRVGPVYVDFHRLLPRRGYPALARREPLARALGKDINTVIDATAGLAQDAFRLACAGYRVVAIERHPVVAALVRDGLRRMRADPAVAPVLGQRLTLMEGDARVLLPTLAPRPDAVYIDPMFPPKRKLSAAVRKEMRLLRLLVGEDSDLAQLLAAARAAARLRVVIKRPDDAPPIEPEPMASYEGKLVRYDVYRPFPPARQVHSNG